jgi:hypothetical protein
MKYNKQDIVLTISFHNEIKEDYFMFKIWRTMYEKYDKYDVGHDEPPAGDVPIEMQEVYWDESIYTPAQNEFIVLLLNTIVDLIDTKFLAAYYHWLRYGKQDTTEVVINGYEALQNFDS